MAIKMAMSIRSILGETFRLPSKSRRLFLLLLAVFFVPQSLQFVASYVYESPLYVKIAGDLSAYTSMQGVDERLGERMLLPLTEDLRSLGIYKIFSLLFVLVVSVFLWIMVVHWASAARRDEQLTPRDLVAKVGGAWKRTLITILFRIPIFIAYLLVSALACGLSVLVFFHHALLMSLCLLAVLVMSLGAFIYLILVCNLAAVVSVMEADRYGFGAYDEAMKVMRGRRMQGFRLFLALFGIDFVLFFLCGMLTFKADGAGAHLLVGLVSVSLQMLLAIFNMAACTLFYEDCSNTSSDEKFSALVGLEIHYDKVPTEV